MKYSGGSVVGLSVVFCGTGVGFSRLSVGMSVNVGVGVGREVVDGEVVGSSMTIGARRDRLGSFCVAVLVLSLLLNDCIELGVGVLVGGAVGDGIAVGVLVGCGVGLGVGLGVGAGLFWPGEAILKFQSVAALRSLRAQLLSASELE